MLSSKNDGKRGIQKARTKANKVKKYQKLLKEKPNDPHAKRWKEQVKFNS